MLGKAILVVDDDEDVRLAIKEALELEGHEVFTASNGLDAITFLKEKIDSQKIGLIILDIMMPGMTGIQFVDEVQEKHPQIARIPIVLATAKGKNQDQEPMGVVASLKKPFDIDELNDVVTRYL